MIEIISAQGDSVYMAQKMQELLNAGYELLHIQTACYPGNAGTRYDTIAYFKKTTT